MRYEFFYRNRWFLAVVILPTFLAMLYYGLIASDQYVSESRFVVKNRSDRGSQTTSLASLLQTTGMSSGEEQTNEVLEYIRSRNALSDLQKQFDVRHAYTVRDADFLSRYDTFWREDRFENLYRYYTHKVETHLDNKSGLAVLEVHAFSADDAQKINELLLDYSEQLVNNLNVKANQNGIAEAQKRVEIAENRVRRALVQMARYRNEESLLDPAKQASGVLDISDKLIAEQTSLQAQLEVMQRVTPDNPAIAALHSQIAAIGKQIEVQNARAVGNHSAIASKLADYENLQAEQEFGTQALTAARTSLEQAQTEAARQQFYLERVVEPNKPDLARLPRRFLQVLTVFAVAVCLYLIGWMLVVGILEHAPED
ncbi:capsule biosynthesis protein [Nostoc sp. 3335mG]|nr:capsule biosynthesis protein [Nostoc sp. 3335mG]